MAQGPRFVLYDGKEVKAEYPFDKDTPVLGRALECDITIDDASISRQHARVTLKPDRITIEDLGSLNGTYINDDAIKRGHIENGDRVSIGSVDLYFRDD